MTTYPYNMFFTPLHHSDLSNEVHFPLCVQKVKEKSPSLEKTSFLFNKQKMKVNLSKLNLSKVSQWCMPVSIICRIFKCPYYRQSFSPEKYSLFKLDVANQVSITACIKVVGGVAHHQNYHLPQHLGHRAINKHYAKCSMRRLQNWYLKCFAFAGIGASWTWTSECQMHVQWLHGQHSAFY